MAAFAGVIAGLSLSAQNPTRSTDLDGNSVGGTVGSFPASNQSGARTFVLPTAEPKFAFGGAESTATHFWDQAILTPTEKALGLLASTQTFTVELWNTYRRTQYKITAASVSGSGGLQLSGVSLPAQLPPLGSQIFTATVPAVGSATINNTGTFQVGPDAGGATLFQRLLAVTGMRITPFPFDPDWDNGVRERAEYRTEIITARSGMEQRYKLRMRPRRSLEWDISTMSVQEAQTLEALLWQRSGSLFAVPWWPDGVPYIGSIAAGASAIAIDTTNRLFKLAPLVMIWQDSQNFEVQSLQSVGPSAITISPTSKAWQDPLIIPAFTGRLPADLQRTRDSNASETLSVAFQCEVAATDPRPSPAAITTAYGYDVLEVEPDWTDPRQTAKRLLQRVDNGMGPVLVYDRGGVSFETHSFKWFLDGRAQVQQFRDFFDLRAGRLVPFWAPSWREDLTLVVAAAAGDSALVVKQCGYTDRMFPDAARRYLAIMTGSGNRYRKVTSASQTTTTETLTLDSPIGIALPVGTPISFLTLARLSDDAHEIEWASVQFAEASLQHVELPKETP